MKVFLRRIALYLFALWSFFPLYWLLNTSFNCQEPIVETPKHAIRTFKKTGLNLLIIEDWIIRK